MIEELPPIIKPLELPKDPGKDGYSKHASKAEEALIQLKDTTSSSADLNDSSLLQITAYTDTSSPWTTSNAATVALSLLTSLPADKTSHLIINTILQEYLRPIFSQATAKITASGRPSQYPEQDATPAADRKGWEEPAWKKAGLMAIPTFAWAVEAAESDLIQANWPLFTPVLLALLEDRETLIRRKGLDILITFIEKTPPKILTSTGIGTVFQEAVFPTLLYLPTLTPEVESVALLRPAYAALLTLAKADEGQQSLGRRKQLDKLLRDGVFAAYHHSSEHLRIVEVLMDATSEVVVALSIYAAKHLQNVVGMISSVMTDPFATAHSPAILAACKTLNTCTRECWPRMTEERSGEVMRMLIMCWLNVRSTTTGPKLEAQAAHAIEAELKTTSKLLFAINEQNSQVIPPDLLEIVQKEPQLKELFPITETSSK